MEWNLNRIPKLMFGFWMTVEFPWVRFLTLETFRKHHPDWKMILYRTPDLQTYYNGNRIWLNDVPNDYLIPRSSIYWHDVESLNIEIREIDVEAELGVKLPNQYCTIYADIMRYIVLKKHGGFYIDLDNLFFRSLESMPFNKPDMADKDVFILNPPYHHIILGVPGASYYDKVLDTQKSVLSDDPNKILMTTACTEFVRRTPEDKVQLLPLIVTEDNFNLKGPVNEWALCLNWHGSGTYGKYQTIDESNFMLSDHPLASCIRYCLYGNMGSDNGIGTFKWIERGE